MTINDNIVGTYWMVVNADGEGRIICQGDKPILSKSGGWLRQGYTEGEMGWLFLDDYNDRARKNGKDVHSEDFKDLKFPKITFKNSPMQIEITKSGRVYQIVEI